MCRLCAVALVDIHLRPADVRDMGASFQINADCPNQAMETPQETHRAGGTQYQQKDKV